MKIWAIADLHLGEALHKPMAIFGAHWEQHTQKLKKAWEACIEPEDVILLPGDLSWGMNLAEAYKDLAFIDALPGKKICIKGNHDYWWQSLRKLNNSGFKTLLFLQNNTFILGKWGICGTRGWLCPGQEGTTLQDEKLFIREIKRLKLSLEAARREGAEELLVMLHYPPTLGGQAQSPLTTLLKEYPVKQVVYGHLHDTTSWEKALKGYQEGILYRLVAADYLEFKPLCLIEDRTINDERNIHEITSCI
ncbi:serine/threonine protein phosphatase [Sporanaerobium hydrogeniformans]|uniref:Serine/threonine protein phosphatase n=1 Tax=Sporanaerobium hydrogeniformans TaxID=3072179 RepID=A0AC61DF50_9FIRM|nr:metallophosphoesterase [Sporanaerobium hydrogeniformans]PHV71468.1 serine/threonine protein phosphatase [Sporanaerobium hydrogeniformans]